MNRFRTILAGVCYISAAGAPILAATGVGVIGTGALAAAGGLAAAILHFMDRPTDPASVTAVITQAREAAKAVKVARKGWSGS